MSSGDDKNGVSLEKSRWLEPTWFLDWDEPRILAFSRSKTEGATSNREKGIRLFYAVRDGLRYDPYAVSHAAEDYRASAIVRTTCAFTDPRPSP